MSSKSGKGRPDPVGLQRDSLESPVVVAAFYQFGALHDFRECREPLRRYCDDLGLLGTILLAAEGINGAVAGSDRSVRRLVRRLRGDPRLADLQCRYSRAPEPPFYRMKVRLKREIVSLGVAGVDPSREAGEYVRPEQWNALISRPDVRLIDARNQYECRLGTFRRAEDPGTRSFRELPAWLDSHLDAERDQHVAMFCTGGIRCEKATAYLRRKGFGNVYHLQGGILNYLEWIPPGDSLWRGECFVFDNRVSIDHRLEPGEHELCPACRMPLTEDDRQSSKFERHVSCPQCFDRLTPARRESLLERARQIELAERRGRRHLGSG